ncbi:LamG-like jellyroll fold domain-containing protein [Kitasatospora indigofera]|uniref:LamG-like jellyroll fold domain-containing protein n=1 Tax=Kitasatospora indigofera TaxID=67307 RepID=UPI00167C8D26|nr:LamG-like jellyroll fold domain-containing protein [Kitasatospora indigofera]
MSPSTVAAADAQRQQERPPTDEVGQAIAQAKASGKPVTINSLTTEFSETVATPAGHLGLTGHPDQQRVKRAGSWSPLDATLVANPDGTFSPKSSATNLVLSTGGDGPLATMTSSDGKKLALKAPFKLPTPTASGDSLLYPSVAPDIDLKVTSTKLGGLTTVLVVNTQAAAANPLLKNLHFDTTTDGVQVTSDSSGNITATASDGKPRWIAPTPRMWDSTTPAAPAQAKGTAAAAAAASGTPADPATDKAPTAGTTNGPGAASKTATMPVATDAHGISLTPDQDLLAHGTAPYFIDPAWIPWSTSANAWTWVQSAYPGTSNWGRTGGDTAHPGVGVCGYYANGGSCSPADKQRTYYQFDTSPLHGAVFSYATINMEEYLSADWNCSTPYPLDLYLSGAISNATTWSNQPGHVGGSLGRQTVGGSGRNGCYNNVPFSYTVTSTLQQYGGDHDTLTFSLEGDESNANAFKRFTYQPSLYVEYDRTPNVPANPGTSPAPTTLSPWQVNQACNDSSPWSWLGAGTQQAGAVSLNATVSSPSQAQLWSWSHIWDYNLPGAPDVASDFSALVASGSTASYTLPPGVIKDGHGYGYGIMATDQLAPWSAATPTCHFAVDLTPPTVAFPATVSDTNTQFPPSGNGQIPKIYAGHSGAVPIITTDPNPSGLATSGLACLRWGWDPQLAGAQWQCGAAMPSGQIPNIIASHWGTNILYVQAADNASNVSPIAPYAFYAPWNPDGPAPVFGDVTGDSAPDIVTPDASGNLRAYTVPGNPLALAPATLLAAPNANAPDGASWVDVKTTHRGSLRGGMNVDDLIAHKDGDLYLYLYQNPGNTGIPGAFDAAVELDRPQCDTGTPNCAGYASDWSTTTQIAAVGDPVTSNLNTAKQFQNRTGLFTIETTASGSDAALWYYPTISNSTFGTPIKLEATGWKDRDLLSPGDWAGQGHPGLWARSRGSGEVRGYTFNLGTTEVTDSFGHVVGTTTNITGIATNTVIVEFGVTYARWRYVGSDGDLTGSGHATLWGVTLAGDVQIWTGQPTGTSTDPGYTWATGPDSISSTAINPLRWKLKGTVNDTTNTNNLTNYNAYSWGTDHNGTANGAAVFNATNYLQGVNPGLDTTKSYSVAAWMKVNKTTDWQTAVCLAGNQRSPFYLQYSMSYGTWAFLAAGSDDANTGTYYAAYAPTPAATGTWAHLVGTYNADTKAMTLYVNGTAVGTTTNQSPWKTTGPVIIGASAATGYPLSNQTNGSISDVRLYPYTLTSQQVASVMAGN